MNFLLSLLLFLLLHPVLTLPIQVAFLQKSTTISPPWQSYNPPLNRGREARKTKSSTASPEFQSFLGGSFLYTHSVPPGTYSIKYGMLTTGPCKTGGRIFTLIANKVPSPKIDIYAAVGCNKEYYVTVEPIVVTSNGKLILKGSRSGPSYPLLSNFVLTLVGADPPPPDPPVQQESASASPKASLAASSAETTSPTLPIGVTPASTPAESPSVSPSHSLSPVVPTSQVPVDIEMNVGGGGTEIVPTGAKRAYHGGNIAVGPGMQKKVYKTARYGTGFEYEFDLAPGAYDVTVGFVENYAPHCVEPGKRIFNMYINGQVQLQGFDIFVEAGNRCNVAFERTFPSQAIGSVDTRPLTIRFEAVKNFGQLSYLRIVSAAEQCIPASTGGSISNDHAAHSVPGSYPPQLGRNSPTSYVDTDGDGFRNVQIDGSGSHTHFFDSARGIVGQVTEYTWTLVETGEVISTKKSFYYTFPLGTTRLRLAVLDNSCTRDDAETTVTVTGKVQPGQYCYYYQGLSEIPEGGTLLGAIRPSFAAVSRSASLGFPSFSFDSTLFAVRCQFFFQNLVEGASKDISVDTAGSGQAVVYEGQNRIWDSSSSATAEIILAVGLTAFEVIYLRTSEVVPASLTFLVGGVAPGNDKISHDRNTILPVLLSVFPSEGKKSGGNNVRVSGYGLFDPLTVTFGGKSVSILSNDRKQTQFVVKAPPFSTDGVVQIIATSGTGAISNAVNYGYGSVCDPVEFISTSLKEQNEEIDNIGLPTCAVVGHDGKIYMGTLGGTVQVLSYQAEDLKLTSLCYSKPIKNAIFIKNNKPAVRDILGIALDPRDVAIRPYVSTNTLYWEDKNRLDNPTSEAWRNGAVERLKVGTDGSDASVCLVFDKTIVSNLPVSNHDHGVNSLVFTQTGDLLIAVGGTTNMGLPGWKLGGIWETALSAAVVIAKLSKGNGFNGRIEYENEDVLRLAKVKAGDVEVYAFGLRNVFGMSMATTGEVYATDQGPNCGFGDTSSTCSEYDETRAQNMVLGEQVNWKGLVKHGWTSCPYSISRPDKVLHLKEGSTYGHPNIQRGGDECAWIDPNDGLTADNKNAPSSYKKHMALLTSSVTAIGEYGGNHFCGDLRGDLILSTYKGRKTYRMGVNGGDVTSGPNVISQNGGIAFVENAHGDLIFPRLTVRKVEVLRPKVSERVGLFVAGAVPFRHGRQGGTGLDIGGSNFGTLPTVTVGGKSCTVTSSSGSEIRCTVPASNVGGLVSVEVNALEGGSAVLNDAILYMEV